MSLTPETDVAVSETIPITEVFAPASSGITRRGILKISFFGALFAMLGGIGATVVNTLYPRNVIGFGGPVALLADQIPKPGDPPKQSIEGHFLLVNLKPDEGRVATDDAPTAGGLLALWWKCPHLGCTIPWKGDFVSPFDDLKRKGMFNCNCHGSTYTKAGALVKGPATRAMDTMAIEVTKTGIVVQTGSIRKGDNDNPRRAIPYPAQVQGASATELPASNNLERNANSR